MLRELRITGLGVIESATVEFSPGLTALTGETGAGKTMVTSGVGLLLGDRADASTVRRGSGQARVEGRFENPRAVLSLLDDVGADLDDGDLLVARQVTDQGRSRAWVGGVQTPAGRLAEVTSSLITIHGQSEQVRLASPDRQREVLDRSCGNDHLEAVGQYRAQFVRRRHLADELDALRSSTRERAREADLLRFGCDEISAVAPQPGEDEALHDEARRLQSLDDLRALASRVSEFLSGDPDGDADQPGAVGLVGLARKAAEQLSTIDDQASDLANRLAEISLQVNDLAADAARYQDDLAADPARLEAVMQRQADLNRLTRKYGDTIAEVLTWAAQAQSRLGDLDHSDDRIAELEAALADLDADLTQRAATLTATRRSGAAALEAAVATELAALALPHATLSFRLDPSPALTAHGAETVSLLFSANPGSQPGPLGRVASGGELSRVRLALEVVLAEADPGHTFVFDEVDAGVGGAVALEIGRRLARLAQHSQVVVVTHLAQVAAFADRQVVVAKSSDGQVTTSDLRQVSGQDRESELARMMAGLDALDSARAHARDLLNEAGGQRSTSAKS